MPSVAVTVVLIVAATAGSVTYKGATAKLGEQQGLLEEITAVFRSITIQLPPAPGAADVAFAPVPTVTVTGPL